ncbi:MAG: GNAT family N-acetyltransferase [Gammaproteobacteria bacterium]
MIQVRIAASTEEFDALEDNWTRLHAASGKAAFQSFPWQRAWWAHFGADNPRLELQLLLVEQDGRLIAIFPCLLERARVAGLVGLRLLRPLGQGVTDYLDVIVMPAYEEQVCRALAKKIVSERLCDVLSLTEVPDGSPLHRLLELLAEAGFKTVRTVREQCPQTRLLGTWDETFATFSKSHRKSLSYLERRLEKTFKVEFRRADAAEEILPEFARFMSMHQRRWIQAGKPGAFANPRVERFHQHVAQQFQARGWLVLGFLLLDGKPMAAMYAFKVGGQLQFYLSGSGEDESVRKYSPGIALHLYCMRQMIDDGVRVYDFLRGTEQYKYDLNAADVPLWTLTAVRSSTVVETLHRIHQARQRAGGRLKERLARMKQARSS